ncbi:hypothetical protein MZM54_04925 [[Brevibacterium] frigoritolerans]|nr:hypothetical protein [Peribacillus frigoritolerans]
MKGSYKELNEVRKTIVTWQNNEGVHPLTCGNDSHNHDVLVPLLEQDNTEFELSIVCIDCDWKQDVPVFLTFKE